MVRNTLYIIIVLVGLLCSGCQNNGNIGTMFGSWRLDEMTVNGDVGIGQEITNTVFSFQNNIVAVTSQYDDYMSNLEVYGTWLWYNEDTLMFSFQNYENPANNVAPYWIGFTTDEVMTMRVTDRTSRTMTLHWEYDGNEYVYKLKKI